MAANPLTPVTSYPADWQQWAVGVLNGIGAPVNDTNLRSLWNWSIHESGQSVMRWNNPLNTTQPGFGGVDKNSVGVKAYPNATNGITATVRTLLNGYYPNIVANLKASRPADQWANAAHDLNTWGSGTGWLHVTGGVAAGVNAAPPLISNPVDAVGSAIKGAGDLLSSVLAHVAFTLAGLLLVLLGVAILLVPELRRVNPVTR